MTDNDDLQLTLQKAVRLHKAGDLAGAETCYQQILNKEPKAPNTLHYLSLLKGEQKDFVASADYAERAIHLLPDNAHYHYTLGNALKQQGKVAEAILAYQQALSLKPEYPEASYHMGEALLLENQFEDAATAFKQALAINPKLAEAYAGLGIARNNQGEFEKAINALKEAVALNPNEVLAHLELAKALMEKRVFNAVEKHLQHILSMNENHREALHLLAEAYYEMGRFDEAITTINKLIALLDSDNKPGRDTNRARAHANLGVYLQIKGDFDGAEKAFLDALAIDDENVTAFVGLELIDRFPPEFNEIEKIKSMLAKPEKQPQQLLAFLHVTLSRLLEKQKQYDDAFTHLHIGKKIKHAETPWSTEPTRHAFEELKHFFTPEFIKSREGVGNPSSTPIFIVSMPRAGSTLTEQILASHSQVFGAGELGAIAGAVSSIVGVNDLDFPYVLKSLTAQQLFDLGEKYLDHIKRLCSSEYKHVTDKLPANFRLIGFIHLILPNAKIVHCIRHPVDTCLGCYKQIFKDINLEYSNDLTDLGEYYRLYNDLMNHWKALFPGKILDVHYEQMVVDQEGQSRRLLDFCELPWEDGVLSYHETKRPVFTASTAQVREPIYTSALGRWKHYEKHLGPLFDALGPLATDYPY